MRTRSLVSALVVMAGIALQPAPAQAQRGRHGGGGHGRPVVVARPVVHSRPVVVARGYYGYPYLGGYYGYPYFDPFWGAYPWYPSPFFYSQWGYMRGGYQQPSAVRLQVTPAETEVYVDGYRAGIADDFDGVFQRLNLPPGPHDIVLYLDGHKTVRQNLHLAPGSTYKIKFAMAPLGPGDAAEPRPEPPPQAPRSVDGPDEGWVPAERVPVPRRPRMPEGPPPQEMRGRSSFGSIAIRVQPGDADVFIDGQRWQGTDREGLVVQVADGPHRVEIRKTGYQTFETEVDVRRGEVTPLNVSLSSRD